MKNAITTTHQTDPALSQSTQATANTCRISVVVCTYNNAPLVEKFLESLARQTLPTTAYEVIVIDNNSTDNTKAVVSEIVERYPNFRYVLEERQGLSHARNRGIDESHGDIIAYTDDDAEPSSIWLERILDSFDSSPDIWCAGGRVVGLWETSPPEWLSPCFHPALSLKDWGDLPRNLEWPERVIGVNVAFRREVFQEIGRFDVNLGRTKKLLLGSEDTEIQQRIHAKGKIVYYDPLAEVRHWVPKERMTRSYFHDRTHGHFRTEAILDYQRKGVLPMMSRTLSSMCQLMLISARSPLHAIGIRSSASHAMRIYGLTGYIKQSIRLLIWGIREE
ncbi:glycosyltransferase [Bremerella sp. JC770]|uniref:glycosyltransferase n=1 Tax=Bremerella sp. JC770 TaxID=3232137 RepID=UPI00345B1040